MTSARRHRRYIAKQKSSRHSFLLLVVLIACFFSLVTFFKLNIKYWNGKDKVAVAISGSNEGVSVILMDPVNSEKIELTIPSNTEVEVARNLGTLLIKNVTQLGINEGIGGKLLPESITKSFLFPVVLWSDTKPDDIKFITTKNTNISFADRVLIYFFTKSVKNLDVTTIDLGKSQFLVKAKLADGTLGYRLPEKISERLLFYFADDLFSGVKVYIQDATGKSGMGDRVGEIIEAIGGKVVTVEKIASNSEDCFLWGKNPEVVSRVADIFSCKILKTKSDFDLQIELGNAFARRF